MAQPVCMGAMLQCMFGLAPSSIMVLPVNRVMTAGGAMPAANIMDNKPMVNILPFGMCSSLANPTVAAATAAALGVLAPMPCIPFTVALWIVGAPTVLIGDMTALNSTSKLMCNWAGMISITVPGQFTVQIP
ncbi:MAG: DUF4280 domain-containing protein [Candidatus Parabeggiatoa sp. nov. 1]|nr:MAG: DUF4280 domain-containing protein [Gammaproteobacteria bacterium]